MSFGVLPVIVSQYTLKKLFVRDHDLTMSAVTQHGYEYYAENNNADTSHLGDASIVSGETNALVMHSRTGRA